MVMSLLSFTDEKTGKVWTVDPLKKIKDVNADVYARWVINCVVPKELLRKILLADFLEPVLVKGKAILSLCCIFMRHAAPVWMPLQIGPSSHNCALRIACIDKRDDTQTVWVDPRYTDSQFAPLLELLGFPKVSTGLDVVEEADRLELITDDGALNCQLRRREPQEEAGLFAETTDFDAYFGAGVRSYSHHGNKDQVDIIDLHKLSDNKFKKMPYEGILQTQYGRWFVDSVYLTEDGKYRWVYEGHV